MANLAVHWLGEPKKAAFGKGKIQNVLQLERIIDPLPQDPDHILVQLDFELGGKLLTNQYQFEGISDPDRICIVGSS
ncbi:MAG: hypothetical protein ACJAYE_002259 [Candidatus Azotimanducaceae bacterium]|jgi:hypothetical protein